MNEKCTKCSCGCDSRKECGIYSGHCGCGKNKQDDGTQDDEETQSLEHGSIKYGPERVSEAFQEGIRQDEIAQEKSESY